MSTFSSALIDALGGTSEAARLMDASPSTVHRMRSEPTPSRLNHLWHVTKINCPDLDIIALAREHGVELASLRMLSEGGVADHGADDAQAPAASSSGNAGDLSQQVAA